MIELVFLACLKSDPDVCREKAVKFMPAANAALCMVQAQPELASWAGNHPDHVISRWWCEDTNSDKLAQREPQVP